MNNQIDTYEDLQLEKERLKNLLVTHRTRIREHWVEVKEELSPLNTVLGVVGKITHGDKSNPMVNIGLRLASDLLLKNLIFAKAGWVTRLAVPLLVRNFSSHVIAEKGRSFVGIVKRIFSKRSKKEAPSQIKYDEFDE